MKQLFKILFVFLGIFICSIDFFACFSFIAIQEYNCLAPKTFVSGEDSKLPDSIEAINGIKLPDPTKPVAVVMDIHDVILVGTWEMELRKIYLDITGDKDTDRATVWIRTIARDDDIQERVSELAVSVGKNVYEVQKHVSTIQRLWHQDYPPTLFHEVLDFMSALCERRVPIFIVSGSPKEVAIRQLKKAGVMKYVDPINLIGLGGAENDKSLTIRNLQKYYVPGSTLVYFDDWKEGLPGIKDVGGIAFAMPQKSGFYENRKRLIDEGADYIMEGWKDYETILDLIKVPDYVQENNLNDIIVIDGVAEEFKTLLPIDRKSGVLSLFEMGYDVGEVICYIVDDDSQVFLADGTVDYDLMELFESVRFPINFLEIKDQLGKDDRSDKEVLQPLVDYLENVLKNDFAKDKKIANIVESFKKGKYYFRHKGVTIASDRNVDAGVIPFSRTEVSFYSCLENHDIFLNKNVKNVIVKNVVSGYGPALFIRRVESMESIHFVDERLNALRVIARKYRNNNAIIKNYLGTGIKNVGKDKETDLIVANFCTPDSSRNCSAVTDEIKSILRDAVDHKLNPNNLDSGMVIGINSLLNIDLAKISGDAYEVESLGELDGIGLDEDIKRALFEKGYKVSLADKAYKVSVYRLKPKFVKTNLQDARSELEKQIFANTLSLAEFLKKLVRKEFEAEAIEEQAFPYLVGYGENLLTRVQRSISRQMLGLEFGGKKGYSMFQDEPHLSFEAFVGASLAMNNIMNSDGLMKYLRVSQVYSNIAKLKDATIRSSWHDQGISLDITNKAAGRILKNINLLNYKDKGLFETMSVDKQSPVLNDFFYALIETRGLPGQFLMGEVTHVAFDSFTGWIREHYSDLKEAMTISLGKEFISDDDFRKLLSDIVYVFNLVDIASSHPDSMGHSWNVRFLKLMSDFKAVITPDIGGAFNTNWSDIYKIPDTVKDRKDYLKTRLAMFRLDNSETSYIYRWIDALPEAAFLNSTSYYVLFESFVNFQGGYIEPATSIFRASTQIKLIVLSIALAKKKGIAVDRHFNINFNNLKKLITEKDGKVNPFKRSLIEGYLSDVKLEDILLGDIDWDKFDADGKNDEALGALQLKVISDPDIGDKGQRSVLDEYTKGDFVGTVMADFKFSKDAETMLEIAERSETSDELRKALFTELIKKYKLDNNKNNAYEVIQRDLDKYELTHKQALADEHAFAQLKTPVCLDIGPEGMSMLIKYNGKSVKRVFKHGISASDVTNELETMYANNDEQWVFDLEDIFSLDKDTFLPRPGSILLRNASFTDIKQLRSILKYCLGILPKDGNLLINFETAETKVTVEMLKAYVLIVAEDLGIDVQFVFEPESNVVLLAVKKLSGEEAPIYFNTRTDISTKKQQDYFLQSA